MAMAGKYFEQLTVDRVFRHQIRRTVTEADNVWFSTVTMNPAPIHLDYDYAANESEFGRPLVNSLLTLGLVVGLSVGDTTLGTTVGNLGFEEVSFEKPVFIGDTIRAETRVVAARKSASRPKWGIVTFKHTGRNQRDEVVVTCVRNAMMLRKPSSKRRARAKPDE